jgi:hypothetical protein
VRGIGVTSGCGRPWAYGRARRRESRRTSLVDARFQKRAEDDEQQMKYALCTQEDVRPPRQAGHAHTHAATLRDAKPGPTVKVHSGTMKPLQRPRWVPAASVHK